MLPATAKKTAGNTVVDQVQVGSVGKRTQEAVDETNVQASSSKAAKVGMDVAVAPEKTPLTAQSLRAQLDEQQPDVSRAGGVPSGFANSEAFSNFGNAVRTGLESAGYRDVEPILQGSAVTGKNFKTGQSFDVGRDSDFDIGLASPSLLKRAEALGIKLRSGKTRTGPLMARDLHRLGLKDLVTQLTEQSKRDVHFMIYNSPANAKERAPSVTLPNAKKRAPSVTLPNLKD
ncbi:hypothetical protein FAZ69_30545 [Trinickia terrae]|uniref:Uncharacterized protein n=1 Tax=Trinickia terrae TaxID=2571161 RepID=A0A4U1HGV3_9BURK|nr:hypothetical protein [Trinickia terrae]TKC79203.1 hypothetical protein FAZ69_30545 [Trinickia terrae]